MTLRIRFKRPLASLSEWEDFAFRQPLGIAIVGFVLAGAIFLLGLGVALVLGVYVYDCDAKSTIEWDRLVYFVLAGPLVESLLLGLVVWPFVSASRILVPLVIGAVAAVIHIFVHGWLGIFAAVPFALFTRLIQFNYASDGLGSGIARAFLMHSAYNLVIFAIAQAC